MILRRKVSVALLALVFMVALVYVTPVEAKKPLRWNYVNIPNPAPDITWSGPISGDTMEGTLYWFNQWYYFSDEGDQHFGGIWWIDCGSDGSVDILGTHKGVGPAGTLQFNINGRVTAACPDLTGRKMHTSGQIYLIDGVPTIIAVLQIN
ncbi:MAG: hypothetical protein ACFFC0_06945 [Promethearchaeota archaeon]